MTNRPWAKLALALAVAGLAIASTSSAAGEVVPGKPPTVQISEALFTPDGGVRPSQLPQAKPAPVALMLAAKIGALEGGHPPALRQLAIQLDRNISIDLNRYPACRPRPSDPPRTLAEACPDSIVGTGTMVLETQFADAMPISTGNPMRIFNGPVRNGTRMLFIESTVKTPVVASAVLTAEIRKIDDGRYGSEMVIAIPRFAGGSGSITSLDLRFKKRLPLAGGWFSPVTARCPDGRLQFRDSAELFDYETGESSKAYSELRRTCTGR